MDINDLTGNVIGAAIEVHRTLGPGLLESIYEECICIELENRKLNYERQKELDVTYKGIPIKQNFIMDIVVNEMLVVELKACEKLMPIHESQLLTYLKLSGIKYGLLINFNVPLLKEGIKRFAN